MKFWSSILLAASILLLSTFMLAMSALGVDMFSPTSEADKKTGVNKSVYYLGTDNQEDEQRKFIIAREIGGSSSRASEDNGNSGTSTAIPLTNNNAEAFPAPNENAITTVDQQKQNPALEKDAEQASPPKETEIKFAFTIKMETNYTAQVLDANGNPIKTFYKDSPLEPGDKTVVWDKKDDNGKEVADGKYTFQLTVKSPGVPVLIYHHLALEGKGYDGNEFTETPANFVKQMDYLVEHNYNTITVDELAEFVLGNKMLPPKSVVITFDDGYQSIYDYAFPILKKRNLKATAFIIGRKAEGHGTSFVPSASFNHLREMYQSGIFDIQSHTYDSHDKVLISPYGEYGKSIASKKYLKQEGRMETEEEFISRITDDSRKGKDTLEKNVGTTVKSLAWPHGTSHEKAIQIAQGMGYKYFIEGNMGPNYIGGSIANIKRVYVKKGISDEKFGKLLNPALKTVTIYSTTAEVKKQ